VILTITGKGHIKENAALHKTLGSIVNALRSVPFIILMVAIIPLTRLTVGSFHRDHRRHRASDHFLHAIHFPDHRILPAGSGPRRHRSRPEHGGQPLQIIWKVLLPEAMHSALCWASPWR
jgi:D-methionine transport system permease protein